MEDVTADYLEMGRVDRELRDQLAMAALTGLLSSGGRVDDEIIKESYLAADLMIAARNRRP